MTTTQSAELVIQLHGPALRRTGRCRAKQRTSVGTEEGQLQKHGRTTHEKIAAKYNYTAASFPGKLPAFVRPVYSLSSG